MRMIERVAPDLGTKRFPSKETALGALWSWGQDHRCTMVRSRVDPANYIVWLPDEDDWLTASVHPFAGMFVLMFEDRYRPPMASGERGRREAEARVALEAPYGHPKALAAGEATDVAEDGIEAVVEAFSRYRDALDSWRRKVGRG